MTNKDAVIQEIESMPEPLLGQLLDFVRNLKLKDAAGRSETAIASEPALAKDWMRPGEDEAWRDL